MNKKLIIASAISLSFLSVAHAEEPAKEPAKAPAEEKVEFKNHEEVIEAMLKGIEELTAVFKTVTDAASATKAEPTIKKHMANMDKIGAAAQALGEPKEEEGTRLEEKYKERMEKAQKEFMGEMMRLMSNQELAQILGGALK